MSRKRWYWLLVIPAVVPAGDPRAADLQLADGHPVIGYHLSVRPDQPRLDAGREPALGLPVPAGQVGAHGGGRAGQRTQR